MVSMPGPLTQSGGRNGQIRLSMLRWCRASDFRTAIVVNILPTLATFTIVADTTSATANAYSSRAGGLIPFKGDSTLYTWLYRIGINTAKNYLIALGRRAPTSTEFDSEEAEGFEDAAGLRDINTPESELASKQIAQTVNDAIAALPEELRTAITLRELDGLSYEEIAQIMNCPIGTVRSRIFRAREAVAEKLRPQLGTSKDKRW